VPPKNLGRGATDFIIQRSIEFPRGVQLTGIESPGLTSAFAVPGHLSAVMA
jgi:hypothetical protein